MKLDDFDIVITSIESTLGQVRKLVYFTVDGESKSEEGHPFEYVYNPNDISDSFLVEFPNDFLNIPCPDLSMNCVDRAFYKLVKQYELLSGLKGDAKDTWEDILS
jgi:hypothetical protein